MSLANVEEIVLSISADIQQHHSESPHQSLRVEELLSADVDFSTDDIAMEEFPTDAPIYQALSTETTVLGNLTFADFKYVIISTDEITAEDQATEVLLLPPEDAISEDSAPKPVISPETAKLFNQIAEKVISKAMDDIFENTSEQVLNESDEEVYHDSTII